MEIAYDFPEKLAFSWFVRSKFSRLSLSKIMYVKGESYALAYLEILIGRVQNRKIFWR